MRGRGVRIAVATLLSLAVLGLVAVATAEALLYVVVDTVIRTAQHLLR